MLLAVTGCVTSPVYAPKNSCTRLLPSEWEDGVGHAPAPAAQETDLERLREWTRFATAEAAQVEKADGRYTAAIGIVRRCEERDREAIEDSRPKFLGVL